MRDKFLKNSKKGMTLPMAIVISIVLVIIAAGLIFIALSSISTTSVTLNGRQAFMNVKSALEYAESYYSRKVTKYDEIGVEPVAAEGEYIEPGTRVEYLVANEREKSGTGEVEIYYERVNEVPADARTYVQAEYIPPTDGSPSLKLTAYSFYSDSFGKSGKMASLSVTFTIGSAGSQNRVTVVNIPKSTGVPGSTNTIRLNLRQPVDLDWDICYYIWTYKDKGNAYSDVPSDGAALKEGASYVYKKNGSVYERVNPKESNLNTSVKHANEKNPNGTWVNTKRANGSVGADGVMIKQSNGWFAGDYKINSKNVNFFNVIFTNKGKLLNVDGGYDTQTCEIFHLWYLNSNDKNIYFEFLDKEKNDGNRSYYTKYWADSPSINPRTGGDWNGVDYLNDTILVYLKNQKTTVHFRMDKIDGTIGSNDPTKDVKITSITNTKDTFSGPTFLENDANLNSLGLETECNIPKKTGNIQMQYEGCGWWVANIDTNMTCTLTVAYGSSSYTFDNARPHSSSTSPDATSELWLIVREKSSETKIESHQTERNALNSLGVDVNSYVTVHAKGYNPDKLASPVLNYMNVLEESCVGRQNLYEKIIEANLLAESDYDDFTAFTRVLQKATDAYNDKEFIQKPANYQEMPESYAAYYMSSRVDNSALDTNTKLQKADAAYKTYTDAVDTAIRNLIPAKVNEDTLTEFYNVLVSANKISADFRNYDAGYYATFISAGQPYSNAKSLAQRIKNAGVGIDVDSTTSSSSNIVIPSTVNRNNLPIKSEITSARTALQNAVNTMDSHKVDRESLQAVIDAAKPYQNSDVYEKEYVNILVDAIKEAEKYIAKDSIIQSSSNPTAPSIEAHKRSVNSAKQDVLNHPKPVEPSQESSQVSQESSQVSQESSQVSEVSHDEPPVEINWTDLDAKMSTATTLLNNKTNCTDESVSQLEAALNNARNLKANASATQEQADSMASELGNAIKKFTVYKPENISEKILGANAARIWLQPLDGYTYSAKKVQVDGDPENPIIVSKDTNGIVSDPNGTGLDYFDLDKVTDNTFEVFATDNATSEVIASGQFNVKDITNDNAIFVTEVKDGKVSVSKYELITLFISQRDVLENEHGHMEVTIHGQKMQLGYENNTHYNYVRYALTEKSKVVTINSNLHGATGPSITVAGEYVTRYTPGEGYKVISVSDIYPKKDSSGETNTDSNTGKTVAYAEDYELVNVWEAKADTWRTMIVGDEVSMNDNQICIIFDPQNYDISGYTNADGSVGPFICYWTESGAGGADYEHREQMTLQKFGERNCYYKVVPADTQGLMIAFHSHSKEKDDHGNEYVKYDDGDKITTEDVVLNTYSDGGTKRYKYNVVYLTDSNAVKGTASQINFKKEDLAKHGADNVNVDTNTETTDEWDKKISVDVPYGHTCIILDTYDASGNNKFSGVTPYAHIWYKDDSGNSHNLTSWTNLTPLIKLESSSDRYYYKIVESKYDRFIITNKANGKDGGDEEANKVIRDSQLPHKSGTELYKYYVIRPASDKGVTVTYQSDSVASIKESAPEVETNLIACNMAYVGGGKIRIKNKSFYETYGNESFKNSCDSTKNPEDSVNVKSSNLFGGSGYDRGGSDNRVGDAKLLPYYDWYEYKIPVAQSNSYTFEIKGLDIDIADAKTDQIKKVYGDVWVSLFNDYNTTRDGNKIFTNIELSTFDPDVSQIGSTLSLYFRTPTTTYDKDVGGNITATHTWSDLKIQKLHGTGNIRTGVTGTPLKTDSNIVKFYNISKNTPFVEFYILETITYADGSESKTIDHVYKTKLQGGEYFLFNPKKNSNFGGWEKYTSYNDQLIDACNKLLNMYYAESIINQYNNLGEVVNQSDQEKTQTFSEYLYSVITSNGTCFSRSRDSDPWKTAGAVINGIDDEQAYILCYGSDGKSGISGIVQKYEALYQKMSLARSYIDTPINKTDNSEAIYHDKYAGSQYPEYINRGSNRLYTGISTLKDRLIDAEKAYITGKIKLEGSTEKSDIAAAVEAIEALDRAIANVSVSSEGSIAVVLYDAQGKVAQGKKFEVKYKESKDGSYITPVKMADYNPEGYPIVFITRPGGGTYDAIYDVQILEDGNPIGIKSGEITKPLTQATMYKDQAWVLLDYASNPRWRENSNTDYRVISNEQYVQGSDSDIELYMTRESKTVGMTDYKTEKMNGLTKYVYKTMTVYFTYDTTIKMKDGTEYLIRAGAYTFTNKDTKDPNSPLYTNEVDSSTGYVKIPKLQLFTAAAKKYFAGSSDVDNSQAEAAARYGYYTDNGYGTNANSAQSIGWVTGGNFATSKMATLNGNVNFDMPANSSASFTRLLTTQFYSYSSNKGINFRWSSPKPLYVTSSVQMYASEFRFSAVGSIDATSNSSSHFYLYNYDSGKNDLMIRFYTDVTVSYIDYTGLVHSFVIREGSYRIEKEDKETDYIADLFNESYWKNLVYVHPLDMNGKEITGGAGLTSPRYSN